jgi:hypothetical protein
LSCLPVCLHTAHPVWLLSAPLNLPHAPTSIENLELFFKKLVLWPSLESTLVPGWLSPRTTKQTLKSYRKFGITLSIIRCLWGLLSMCWGYLTLFSSNPEAIKLNPEHWTLHLWWIALPCLNVRIHGFHNPAFGIQSRSVRPNLSTPGLLDQSSQKSNVRRLRKTGGRFSCMLWTYIS